MKSLKVAGVLTAIASILHLVIIIGGAEWYRFFGAGEEMALMSEQGSSYPAILTGGIALILAIWALYAFSGAKLIAPLPFMKTVLLLISGVFLARGLLGIPMIMLADSAYMAELAENMTFMVVTSLVCLLIGGCYSLGWYRLYKAGA